MLRVLPPFPMSTSHSNEELSMLFSRL